MICINERSKVITRKYTTMAWNSLRSFCIGVPERIILRGVRSASNIVEVLLLADLSLWPSCDHFKIKSSDGRMRDQRTLIADDQSYRWAE